MAFLRFLVLLVGAAGGLSATPLLFGTGDLLWVSTADSQVYVVSPASPTPRWIATLGHTQIGQMAFSADAKTAYLTTWDGLVMAIDNAGKVSEFARGLNQPTGLIRTSSGKLLVSSYADGTIIDITRGGDFAGATPLAWNLTTPRNMIETPNGIYVSEQLANEITNIGNGGDQKNKAAFATIDWPTDLAWYNGKLYAVDSSVGKVYGVSGGQVDITNPFAYGRRFGSLAISNGILYGGTAIQTTYLTDSGIWNISPGGNIKSNPLVNKLPPGDSLLGVVPAGVVVASPPANTPEPGTFAAGMALVMFACLPKLRRCR